ncbi:SpoIIAA family protein [Bowmanella dokdonensis]|uniref:STAS/SEC14 domain-containing protein n=1 Tax=Bowmanella dokdonensis TaxID=751969 RepID=A0A939IS58_9ALTE|nr:STAS/SEC14 domain-containing protein [Bowmanella dokdonensis]MBN7826829.1 STAS/SEC14 domain-containing protein [Bowmanella dokdonensis]
MLKLEGINENRVLSITASGKLTRHDYQQLIPEVENLLEKFGTLRFFIRAREISGFEVRAMWEDIKFDARHADQFGKTAIVGEKKWQEWGTELASLFFDAPMKYFDHNEEKLAWTWVNT